MNKAANYLRVRLFWRLIGPFQDKVRGARMAKFASLLNLQAGARILDLGGQPQIWDYVSTPLHITILNLPGIAQAISDQTIHKFTFVDGDACNVTQFEDNTFDIVFSNSVIEHVGDPTFQAAFAKEARRLAPCYWIQTPSIWFPIEAHTGMLGWFLYPEFVRRKFISRWKQKLPAWTEMVEGTTVLSRQALKTLFPDSRVLTEWKYGFPKSYIAFKS